ncbi:hypothetical protein BU24DRAFT_25271 [Aaosphaeria arxii CBS 175.79]|uniref:Uncharacterized protein n=1 Tax=Aaosphaeria arxii CBS 175.79 TaxID=1450172 RepID=A0A6A5Y8X0_9PLEO|nr:uncharacterized protein BU24DRAFT_25271 [Aaosphaeria arxii CBS 175.79]KAF2021673.1 hypothetical protein BU24DRAFT_25271 [Aaosphaeria arxii CBS 175.79]
MEVRASITHSGNMCIYEYTTFSITRRHQSRPRLLRDERSVLHLFFCSPPCPTPLSRTPASLPLPIPRPPFPIPLHSYGDSTVPVVFPLFLSRHNGGIPHPPSSSWVTLHTHAHTRTCAQHRCQPTWLASRPAKSTLSSFHPSMADMMIPQNTQIWYDTKIYLFGTLPKTQTM